jgi:tyrosyl-tRNA synthetase
MIKGHLKGADRVSAANELIDEEGDDTQAAGQEPQTVMVMPLLKGTDGKAKMSKTAGNAIGITEDPAEMFGKVMSVPDSPVVRYYQLAAALPPEAVQAVLSALKQGELHPAAAKRRLARRIVELYHSPEAAQAAERRFDVQFREGGVPDDVMEVELIDLGGEQSWSLPDAIPTEALTRRLIQRGKRRFVKLALRP